MPTAPNIHPMATLGGRDEEANFVVGRELTIATDMNSTRVPEMIDPLFPRPHGTNRNARSAPPISQLQMASHAALHRYRMDAVRLPDGSAPAPCPTSSKYPLRKSPRTRTAGRRFCFGRSHPASHDAGGSSPSAAPPGGEWRGIVDILAVRKDTSRPVHAVLKSGDLLEIVVVQMKGSGARLPSLAEIRRLRAVARRYHAKHIVLFAWKREQHCRFSRLTRANTWMPSTAAELFG